MAHVVDNLVAFGPGLLLYALGFVAVETVPVGDVVGGDVAWLFLIAFNVVVIIGVNLYLLDSYGQTVGKRVVRVMIVRKDGSRASLGRIVLLRTLLPWVVSLLPFVGGVFSLADVLFIYGHDRRCIHDYMAGTVVVTAPRGFRYGKSVLRMPLLDSA